MTLYKGRMTREQVLNELGYANSDIDQMKCYSAPEKPYHPTRVAQRMDPEITKVFNDNGEQLEFVREYDMDDRWRTGCVYAEFKDAQGESYHIISVDEADMDYQMKIHENRIGQNQQTLNNIGSDVCVQFHNKHKV